MLWEGDLQSPNKHCVSLTQRGWQDAESGESGASAGPGDSLDPASGSCAPRTSYPHTGEF